MAFTEAAARGLAVVPPEAWSKDGNDCLTLVVYRERGVGGVSGTPGLLLHNPLEDTDLKDIASVNDAFSLLLHSDCFAEAGTLLDKAAPADGAARAWLLSHKAQLSYLQWVDGGKKDEALLDGVLALSLKSFRRFLRRRRSSPPCRPSAASCGWRKRTRRRRTPSAAVSRRSMATARCFRTTV